MKHFIVWALVLVYTSALDPEVLQQFVEKATKFAEICMDETKASTEDITKLMVHQIPDSHEGKCMVSCIYKKFKIQNEDGTMNYEETLKFLEVVKESDPDLFSKMLDVTKSCNKSELVDADPCITAVNVGKCVLTEAKKRGISTEMFGM